MLCPKCKARLVKGGLRGFETLSDHVENPNREKVPLRFTYVCPNKCLGDDQFFDRDGESYGGGIEAWEYGNALQEI